MTTLSSKPLLFEQIGRLMGRAIAKHLDREHKMAWAMLDGGQCPDCSHAPFKKRGWLYRHLREKH